MAAETTTADPASSARVSVLALLARDSQLICDLLRKAGIHAEPRPSDWKSTLAAAVSGDCLTLTEELLSPELIESLSAILQNQPQWSDFPLILLTLGGEVSVSTQKRHELRHPQ